jgi:hypothetical protein
MILRGNVHSSEWVSSDRGKFCAHCANTLVVISMLVQYSQMQCGVVWCGVSLVLQTLLQSSIFPLCFIFLSTLIWHHFHFIYICSNRFLLLSLPSCRSNGRNTRLECTSFFFPLSVRKSLESGEDSTFRYADAPFQGSDRSSRSAGSDDDDDDDGKRECLMWCLLCYEWLTWWCVGSQGVEWCVEVGAFSLI